MNQDKQVKHWQMRVFSILWVGYASYYMCRMNFAVAQPKLIDAMGWTNEQIGWIPSVWLAFYATGQFINAQIGSRFGARRMMSIGLSVIGILNVLFAFTPDIIAGLQGPLGLSAEASSSTIYWTMLCLWAVNGYCQSIGWPQVVQTMSNWFRVGRRGTMMGLISTCYTGGNVIAWVLSGMLVQYLGWKAAFLVPGITMFPVLMLFLLGIKNRPEEVGLEPIRDDLEPEPEAEAGAAAAPVDDWTIWRILRTTLSSGTLWVLAWSYFCFNAVRYSFMNWTVQYFNKFHGQEIKNSAFLAVLFPLIGALGAISSGWVSDRFFQGRRAPVCAVMLAILGGLCLAFIPIPAGDAFFATILLAGAGFMIYGPDAILTGAAVIDVAHPKAAASAAGFIMAMGNIGGSLVAGFLVGRILDQNAGDWTLVFQVLAGLSVAAAAMSAVLWNKKPKGK